MHLLRIRIVLLMIVFIVTGFICVQREAATEDPPRSSRVGPFRIPLTSYERIPIGTVLAHPDRYRMREIRLSATGSGAAGLSVEATIRFVELARD